MSESIQPVGVECDFRDVPSLDHRYEHPNSRAFLQRTELGPVVHAIAHALAPAIEKASIDKAAVLLGDTPFSHDIRLNYAFLRVGRCMGEATGLVLGQTIFPDSAQQIIDAYRPINPEEDKPKDADPNDLTFHAMMKDVVLEGALSGVAMPLHVYRKLTLHRAGLISGGDEAIRAKALAQAPFVVDEVVRDMRSTWFNDILQQLAYAPNGFYGAASSSPGVTNSPDVLSVHTVFEETDEGFLQLSQGFVRVKKSALRKETHDGRESGGCPVRHGGYKLIGPLATMALQEMGIDPSLLPVETAISRYRRLVADVIEALGNQKGPAHE